jgi:hypothetical protein
MSQNVWATIMPFGPVTLIFYWPKKKISGQQMLALISGIVFKGQKICHRIFSNEICRYCINMLQLININIERIEFTFHNLHVILGLVLSTEIWRLRNTNPTKHGGGMLSYDLFNVCNDNVHRTLYNNNNTSWDIISVVKHSEQYNRSLKF